MNSFTNLPWPSLQELWGWDAAEPVWRCAQEAAAGDAHAVPLIPCRWAGGKGARQLGCVWNASHPWSRICGAQQRSPKGGQSPAGYSGIVSVSQCRMWLFTVLYSLYFLRWHNWSMLCYVKKGYRSLIFSECLCIVCIVYYITGSIIVQNTKIKFEI